MLVSHLLPALGALLAKASKAAVSDERKAGSPPVVLWGRGGTIGGIEVSRSEAAVAPVAGVSAAAKKRIPRRIPTTWGFEGT